MPSAAPGREQDNRDCRRRPFGQPFCLEAPCSEAGLDDPKYVGPEPDLLLSEEEKRDAEETDAEAKAASTWDLYKEAADDDIRDLFTPDFTPDEMFKRGELTVKIQGREDAIAAAEAARKEARKAEKAARKKNRR